MWVGLRRKLHKAMDFKGGIKNCFFFGVSRKGGGGSRRIQNFLNRKTEIFLPKGGGLTQSKRVLSEKMRFLGIFWQKGGILSEKKWEFFGIFGQKGLGGSPPEKNSYFNLMPPLMPALGCPWPDQPSQEQVCASVFGKIASRFLLKLSSSFYQNSFWQIIQDHGRSYKIMDKELMKEVRCYVRYTILNG